MPRTLREAEVLARDIVTRSAWINGFTNVLPVVGGTISLGVDVLMARQVADAFGIGTFDQTALESHLATMVGAAFAGRAASHVLHVIPIIGSIACAVSSGMIAAYVGDCLIEYFKVRSPLAA